MRFIHDVDCDFDNSSFCGWRNDHIGRAKHSWTLRSGRTPSDTTGPQADASGNMNKLNLEMREQVRGWVQFGLPPLDNTEFKSYVLHYTANNCPLLRKLFLNMISVLICTLGRQLARIRSVWWFLSLTHATNKLKLQHLRRWAIN